MCLLLSLSSNLVYGGSVLSGKMPPVRRSRNFSQLRELDRGRIVGLREAGKSFREIGAIVLRSVSTVSECWWAWTEEGR